MGYSENDNMVRVDFFKESGGWCCTEAVEWLGRYYKGCLIHYGFEASLTIHLVTKECPKGRLFGMTAVCLKPQHEHAHPITTTVTEEMIKQYKEWLEIEV